MFQHFQLNQIRTMIFAATAAIIAISPWANAADPFPNKPLKIIVTAAPGGTTDIATRQLSDVLSRELGQTVVVENKAGGAGIIALQACQGSLAKQWWWRIKRVAQALLPFKL